VLATMGAMGVVGACLFGLGITVAMERAQGWFLLKRATPMHPLVYVAGKTAASMAFAAVVVVSLCLCAALLGGVRLTAWRWALLAAVLVVGSAPFCAIGAALGFLTGPNAAPAVINFIHLPAAFASGLWMRVVMLIIWMAAGTLAAVATYRRDEGKRYG
jgi:ABC-2 type transport system permease protein